jgi:hypothetical protein
MNNKYVMLIVMAATFAGIQAGKAPVKQPAPAKTAANKTGHPCSILPKLSKEEQYHLVEYLILFPRFIVQYQGLDYILKQLQEEKPEPTNKKSTMLMQIRDEIVELSHEKNVNQLVLELNYLAQCLEKIAKILKKYNISETMVNLLIEHEENKEFCESCKNCLLETYAAAKKEGKTLGLLPAEPEEMPEQANQY